MVYSGAWGKLIHEKNQKQKISWHCPFKWSCTAKKENKIFLIYKEILMGSVAKAHLRKGFLIYKENVQIFNHT